MGTTTQSVKRGGQSDSTLAYVIVGFVLLFLGIDELSVKQERPIQ